MRARLALRKGQHSSNPPNHNPPILCPTPCSPPHQCGSCSLSSSVPVPSLPPPHPPPPPPRPGRLHVLLPTRPARVPVVPPLVSHHLPLEAPHAPIPFCQPTSPQPFQPPFSPFNPPFNNNYHKAPQQQVSQRCLHCNHFSCANLQTC